MKKIMIVDDEGPIREWLAMCIEQAGEAYEIVGSFKNGEEAMNQLEIVKPDIVFTDIVMPKVNGLELLKAIRGIYSDVKVAILTSHNDFEFAQTAIRNGADDYFLKTELNKSSIFTILERFSKQIDLNLVKHEEKLESKHAYSENIEKAIGYITANFAEQIRLGDVADEVGFNEEYFSRLFKKETGVNYVDFLNTIRMQEAERLVKTTNLAVNEIATTVGINNPAYFTHLFKKQFNISPSKMRNI